MAQVVQKDCTTMRTLELSTSTQNTNETMLDLRKPKAYYWREDQGIPTNMGYP